MVHPRVESSLCPFILLSISGSKGINTDPNTPLPYTHWYRQHSCDRMRGKPKPCSVGKQRPALLPGSLSFPGSPGQLPPNSLLSAADKIRSWQSHPPVCCAARLFPSQPQMKFQEGRLELTSGDAVKPTPTAAASWDMWRMRVHFGNLPEHFNLLSWTVPQAAAQKCPPRSRTAKIILQEALCSMPMWHHGGDAAAWEAGRRGKGKQRPLLFPREGHRAWDLQ